MLYEQVLRFFDDPAAKGFEALALEAFAFQFERIPAYRRLCERRDRRPSSVSSWQEVPPVPAAAFKSLELATGPGGVVFRSSGTTAGEERRSVHRNPYPDLYRASIDHSFPQACLPWGAPREMLSLIPSRQVLEDSSLSFMVDHIFRRWASPNSVYAFGHGGLDAPAARQWCRGRENGKPVLILATALALLQWVEELEALGETLSLPRGSLLFETGGFKGRHRATSRQELVEKVRGRLGLSNRQIVREYGMSELSSQFYTRIREGGSGDVFYAPPWTRVRILNPSTLEEAGAGTPGLLAIFDLANLGSAVHILTEDLGLRKEGGFQLLGRASGAQLRGCSLSAEELSMGELHRTDA